MKALRSIYILKGIFWGLLIILTECSCSKLVDIKPPESSVNQENVYAVDQTATAVLTGMYNFMSFAGAGFTGDKSISELAALSADEFNLYNGISKTDVRYQYFTNTLFVTKNAGAGTELWSTSYNFIYVCNAAIEGLNASNTLTPSVKQQLLGEAKFMRAFFYFYLVNLYGDLPVDTSTNWQSNSSLSRSPQAQVYKQIISDLKDAQGLLSTQYLNGSLQLYTGGPAERVRPTQAAAKALLARAYLYNRDYPDAETQASAVIGNSLYSLADSLNHVFIKNSTEAIWQLQPVTTGHNTEDAWTFIIPSTGLGDAWPVYLNNALLNSFEAGDQRRLNWVDSVIVSSDTLYFPYKYQSATYGDPVNEYLVVLRLSEQYLIRAEARAQQNNIQGAQMDLNMIRSRAGLQNTSANDQAALLSAVLHERQTELFTEWGHRWLDLKRTQNVDAVMGIVTPQKGGANDSWNSFQQLYPILVSDILSDPNLSQNSGYSK